MTRADAAEQRAIEEIRQMGQEVLANWAEGQVHQSTEKTASREGVQRRGKKALHWHSSFGIIRVTEPLFRQGKQQIRPFCESSGVMPRGYSLPLQRIVVDFGADHAFWQSPEEIAGALSPELAYQQHSPYYSSPQRANAGRTTAHP